MMFCRECGRAVRPKENPWTEVVGFERKREAGGTNHVALRKRTGVLICPQCMVRLQAGLDAGQLGLLQQMADLEDEVDPGLEMKRKIAADGIRKERARREELTS
jgi:hypothetical protein